MRRIGHLYPGLSQASPAAPRALTLQDASRKRSKDTSGVGVSPHTQQVRPTAKQQTVGASGRRLCFRVQDESKIKHSDFDHHSD